MLLSESETEDSRLAPVTSHKISRQSSPWIREGKRAAGGDRVQACAVEEHDRGRASRGGPRTCRHLDSNEGIWVGECVPTIMF